MWDDVNQRQITPTIHRHFLSHIIIISRGIFHHNIIVFKERDIEYGLTTWASHWDGMGATGQDYVSGVRMVSLPSLQSPHQSQSLWPGESFSCKLISGQPLQRVSSHWPGHQQWKCKLFLSLEFSSGPADSLEKGCAFLIQFSLCSKLTTLGFMPSNFWIEQE